MLYLNLPIIKKIIYKEKAPIKIWKRSILVTEAVVGIIFSVYNGKHFINILVTNKMINRKLGEFSLTRKYPKHPIKDKNLKKKKVKK
jgi:small subunit ribosomal protein S19